LVRHAGLIIYPDWDARSGQWLDPARPARYTRRFPAGEKPGDLPIPAAQQDRAGRQSQDRQGARPDDPPSILARADEVIE
jgi:hypothetical protein